MYTACTVRLRNTRDIYSDQVRQQGWIHGSGLVESKLAVIYLILLVVNYFNFQVKMSLGISRVQVHLRRMTPSVHFSLANFGECLIDHFDFAQEGEGYVILTHEDNKIKLERASSPKPAQALLLRHAVECPVYKFSNSTKNPYCPTDLCDKGIGIGVVVLLTSSDQHVLVTRRAPHMRTFPGVWVPPGGHIELGESISGAGIRELKEETGLTCEGSSHQMLCLWESVYPHKLELGDPIRQHLVIYIAIQSLHNHKELSEHLKVSFPY